MQPYINKSLIRKTCLSYRKKMCKEEFKKRNKEVMSQLLNYITHKHHIEYIHTFLPIEKNNEPNVFPILPSLRSINKKIVVSKTDFKNKDLSYWLLESDTVLVKTQKNLLEPINTIPVDPHKIDVFLVPLLVGDKKGNRIGYGGGYYDRLIKKYRPETVGLSLAPLLNHIQQIDTWDQPLDVIITPFSKLQ